MKISKIRRAVLKHSRIVEAPDRVSYILILNSDKIYKELGARPYTDTAILKETKIPTKLLNKLISSIKENTK